MQNASASLILVGDGSSKSITVPLAQAPLRFEFGLNLHNPNAVLSIAFDAGFSGSASLSGTFNENLALTSIQDPNNGNAAIANGATLGMTFQLAFAGV